MREHVLLFCLLRLVLTATILLVAAPGAVTWALVSRHYPRLKIGREFFPAGSEWGPPRLLLFYCSPRTLKTLTGR
jgi:hypothetical protein